MQVTHKFSYKPVMRYNAVTGYSMQIFPVSMKIENSESLKPRRNAYSSITLVKRKLVSREKQGISQHSTT